ncbi:hypothetical protein BaRGS_00027765 [Batillaria attramentaria]|uniref:Uncharacterized protein n=1 Tax=Batillaria attramentaria TaxID=370345 RepID=A0ABD0K0R2_9CAEN
MYKQCQLRLDGLYVCLSRVNAQLQDEATPLTHDGMVVSGPTRDPLKKVRTTRARGAAHSRRNFLMIHEPPFPPPYYAQLPVPSPVIQADCSGIKTPPTRRSYL